MSKSIAYRNEVAEKLSRGNSAKEARNIPLTVKQVNWLVNSAVDDSQRDGGYTKVKGSFGNGFVWTVMVYPNGAGFMMVDSVAELERKWNGTGF